LSLLVAAGNQLICSGSNGFDNSEILSLFIASS
jgi:hypothetical protein